MDSKYPDAEPCIICNKEARDAMTEGSRIFTEDLLVERPPDCVPGSPCWNCYGLRVTSTTDQYQEDLSARIIECLRGIHQ
jgi:hypothetical protein